MTDQATHEEYSAPPFHEGDWAVHPTHGLGKVERIEEKNFGGTAADVYVLSIVGSELRVLVPTSTASRVGLRQVMSTQQVDEIFAVLAAPENAVSIQPWSRRFRAYSEMMASGSPTEVAKVLRDMQRLKYDKNLSFGERRLLEQALALLKEEMAVAVGVSSEEMGTKISAVFSA